MYLTISGSQMPRIEKQRGLIATGSGIGCGLFSAIAVTVLYVIYDGAGDFTLIVAPGFALIAGLIGGITGALMALDIYTRGTGGSAYDAAPPNPNTADEPGDAPKSSKTDIGSGDSSARTR